MKFKDLSLGEKFEFTSVDEFPFSGMERGPWIKKSARLYSKDTSPFFADPLERQNHIFWGLRRNQVGSINIEVKHLD